MIARAPILPTLPPRTAGDLIAVLEQAIDRTQIDRVLRNNAAAIARLSPLDRAAVAARADAIRARLPERPHR